MKKLSSFEEFLTQVLSDFPEFDPDFEITINEDGSFLWVLILDYLGSFLISKLKKGESVTRLFTDIENWLTHDTLAHEKILETIADTLAHFRKKSDFNTLLAGPLLAKLIDTADVY